MRNLTFLDLIQDIEFRQGVSQRIATMIQDPCFALPNSFPILYRYRNMSDYAINDILNGEITLTIIGAFNDLFDGAFHRYGSETERQNKAEEKWERFENLRKASGITEQLLDHDYITKLYSNHYKTESRLKFRELDYLGTYVCCFSSQNDSPLMWAHYANSNSGICIAYDFNKIDRDNLFRKTLFPVVYTQNPFDLSDLLDEDKKKNYKYPLDTAVLCSAINKSAIWKYENEWRTVWVMLGGNNDQRMSIKSLIRPHAIYFGYHFLKSLFYYNSGNGDEKNKTIHQREMIIKLLNHMEQYRIKAYVMVPQIGTYTLVPCPITIENMKGLIYQNFHEYGVNIKYYYVIHDRLMDLLGQ